MRSDRDARRADLLELRRLRGPGKATRFSQRREWMCWKSVMCREKVSVLGGGEVQRWLQQLTGLSDGQPTSGRPPEALLALSEGNIEKACLRTWRALLVAGGKVY